MLVGNWRRVIAREFIFGFFQQPYFQTVLRVPMFLALPAFLAGKVTLGGLMQVASAFQNTVTTFVVRLQLQIRARTGRHDQAAATLSRRHRPCRPARGRVAQHAIAGRRFADAGCIDLHAGPAPAASDHRSDDIKG